MHQMPQLHYHGADHVRGLMPAQGWPPGLSGARQPFEGRPVCSGAPSAKQPGSGELAGVLTMRGHAIRTPPSRPCMKSSTRSMPQLTPCPRTRLKSGTGSPRAGSKTSCAASAPLHSVVQSTREYTLAYSPPLAQRFALLHIDMSVHLAGLLWAPPSGETICCNAHHAPALCTVPCPPLAAHDRHRGQSRRGPAKPDGRSPGPILAGRGFAPDPGPAGMPSAASLPETPSQSPAHADVAVWHLFEVGKTSRCDQALLWQQLQAPAPADGMQEADCVAINAGRMAGTASPVWT